MLKKINYIFFLFACLLLFSCSRENGNEGKTVFRYNESKGIATLDPAFAKSQTTIWPVNQLFNGLVQMDDSLHVKPCIAKRWSISADGRIYSFFLRKDVFFHDHELFPEGKGRRVVAQDFVYSLGRIIDSKVASPGAWILSNLDQKAGNKYSGMKAISDTILELTLQRPFPGFLGLLTMQYCSVVPEEIITHYGNDFRSHPVGTGPFYMKLWVEGEKLVFRKNEHYFETDQQGKSLPYLDAVAITFINDKQSEFMEFILGNIDFLSGVNASYKDELISRSGKLKKKYSDRFTMITSPYLNTEYLAFLLDSASELVSKSPSRIKQVRQAFNFGFDRRKMMRYLRNNLGTPAEYGFIPKGMPGFSDKVHGYTYDPDKARKLLAEAGFTNGKGLPEVLLTTTGDYLDLCEYIQHELSQIGIKIRIDVNTGATFRDMVANSKLAFFRGSWVADYADAENYLALFYSKNFSPGGPNTTHFKSIYFDSMYDQAMNETNDTLRYHLYNKMDQFVMDNAVVIPLYYDLAVRFTNKHVVGLTNNPMNLLNLKRVRKR